MGSAPSRAMDLALRGERDDAVARDGLVVPAQDLGVAEVLVDALLAVCARAVVHVRRVPEVAVHLAADLGRERRPRVALVREAPDEGRRTPGARLEVADGQKKTRCLLASLHTPLPGAARAS